MVSLWSVVVTLFPPANTTLLLLLSSSPRVRSDEIWSVNWATVDDDDDGLFVLLDYIEVAMWHFNI